MVASNRGGALRSLFEVSVECCVWLQTQSINQMRAEHSKRADLESLVQVELFHVESSSEACGRVTTSAKRN